ncbi:hypothetical protein [Streptantibioticus silvisoli]|uniref:Uncharacterized protein n=1 Tax=Streptantibioticus silvisoli TaxID=2705255 RepID=A0ABT6W7Y6_9ACTN|nr:hypothetical protein [Streptantibioticus silvisoli]MDI5965793.1 hypothetical protein [Streptantibioticus silvisoli]
MTDVDPDDITVMRCQGDLRAYLRAQIAEGVARRDAKPAPQQQPTPTGRRPGEWPAGTHPPSQHFCPPDCPCPIEEPEATP